MSSQVLRCYNATQSISHNPSSWYLQWLYRHSWCHCVWQLFSRAAREETFIHFASSHDFSPDERAIQKHYCWLCHSVVVTATSDWMRRRVRAPALEETEGQNNWVSRNKADLEKLVRPLNPAACGQHTQSSKTEALPAVTATPADSL